MDYDFPECEKLTGRRKAICRGEGGLPIEGRHGVNEYRRSWGIAPYPFPEPISVPALDVKKPILRAVKERLVGNVPDPVMGRYAGTNLALLLKRFGIEVRTGCNCEEWIDKMNRWTPVENYQHRKEIIDRLKEQADELNRLGQLGVLAKVKIGFLMLRNFNLPTISELVDEAIYQARQHSLKTS